MAIGKTENSRAVTHTALRENTAASAPVESTQKQEATSHFSGSAAPNVAVRLGQTNTVTVFPPRDEVTSALQEGQNPEQIQGTLEALVAKYGVEGVQAVLGSAIAEHNVKAWGAGPAESYQAVADGVIGAQLLARSKAGHPTEKDLGITLDEQGAVSVYEIGEYSARTIRTHGASVEAAQAFAKAQVNMATAADGNQFPSTHWEPVEGKKGFFKSTQTPAECIKHVLENPREYHAECATQTVLANYDAIRRLVGDEKFNALFKGGITVGLSFRNTELEPFLKSDNEVPRIAGEMAYVENPAPTEDAVLKGHRGQNLVLMTSSSTPDKNDFSAWAPGAISFFSMNGRLRPHALDAVISSVNGQDNSHIDQAQLQKRRLQDSSIPDGAYLAPGRTYLDPEILARD